MSTINSHLQMLSMAMGMETNQSLLGQTIDRLSSGSQISSPGDNPAGAATVDELGAGADILGAASTNIQDGLSYAQSADSQLAGIGSVLSRMSELVTYAQNPVASSGDIADYQQEFQALQSQLRSVIGGTTSQIGGTSDTAPSATFEGTQLFGSTASGGITFDTGETPGDQVTIPDMDLQDGGLSGVIVQDAGGAFTMSVTSPGAAAGLSGALSQVASDRASVGGAQSSLAVAAATVVTQQQNTESAVAGINDTDIAAQSTQLATYNILMQSGAAMLAQANAASSAVLKLIQS
jgi:flagellin